MITNSSSSGGSSTVLDKELTFIQFISSEELKESKTIGYDLEKKAAKAIGLSATHHMDKTLLVFGLPGTGVKGFVETLFWELKEKHHVPIYVIHLSCESMILVNETEKTIRDLDMQIGQKLRTNIEKGNFVVFFVERPEALSSKLQNFQRSKSMVTAWLSYLLKRIGDRVLTVITSDDPSSISPPLIRSVIAPIYLRHLDLGSLSNILCEMLSRTNCHKVAEYLYHDVEKNCFKLVSAEVVKAVERAKTMAEDLESLPVEKLSPLIRQHIYPCYPFKYVDDYEKRNENFVSYSRDFVIDYWSKKLDELQNI